MNTSGLCGASYGSLGRETRRSMEEGQLAFRLSVSHNNKVIAWSSSLMAVASMAGLELYAKSITRAGFGRHAGRKSLSQSLSPFVQVSCA